jgi:DNA-binding LacI/PurR family transcriptional regulator
VIPEQTRQRVINAAEALGYERDPMLGALAAYRKGLKSERVHGKVDQT